jgi:hypothetical protein
LRLPNRHRQAELADPSAQVSPLEELEKREESQMRIAIGWMNKQRNT